MRLTFLVLVCALAFVSATRVPPFTFANYWEQFHRQGGCFNDMYLYDEHLDLDAAIHYNTRVVVVGDFSYPFDYTSTAELDVMLPDMYDSELATLSTFVSELSQLAFPISVFEDCDEATGFDFYRSLKVRYMSYDVIAPSNTQVDDPSGSHEYYSPHWYYLNSPDDNCVEDLIDEMTMAHNAIFIESADDNVMFDYSDEDYIDGLIGLGTQLLEYEGRCAPDEKCFMVFARVNPVIFESAAIQDAIASMKAYGYQIVTLDALDYQTQAASTWISSEPQERFAHLLPSPIAPRPQFEGTKLVQAVRTGTSACMSYGMHTIVTYDGYGYAQNELGDFVLAKDLYSNSFEVQIRNDVCDRTSDAHNVACTDGLAVRVGQRTIAFYYDRMEDLLAVTVDGVLARPGYLLYDEFQAFAIRNYPAGYEIGVYTANPFTYIRALFRFTTTVAVYPAPSLQYAMGGLCGTFDGCALDEFYTVDEMFVADHDYFVNSWKVHGGASLFDQPSYMADVVPFVLHPPFVPATWNQWQYDAEAVKDYQLDYCSQYVSGALYDACLYTSELLETVDANVMQMILDMFPQDYTFYDFDLWDPSAMVCAEACQTGYSRMGGFNMVNINCTSICDSNSADMEGLAFTFPDTTSTDYRLKIPVATSNYGKQAFFMAPLGGDYLVRVRSFDCCTESPNVEFVVSVNCEAEQVLVTIPDDIDIVIDEFAIPIIEIQAKVQDPDNENLHVMWEFLQVPTGTPVPEILNPFNLFPSFIPQSAGEYILQVVVTDGCSVSADTVTVTVNCYARDYVLNTQYSDSMVYTHAANWEDSYFSTSLLSLDKSCLAPIGATIAEMFTEFPWTFAPVAWDRDIVRVTDDALEMEVIYENAVSGRKDYVVYWEVYELVATFPINVPEIDNTTVVIDDVTIVPQRDANMLHHYGVIRAEARIDITEKQVYKTSMMEGQYWIHANIRSEECYIYTLLDFDQQTDGTYVSSLSIWSQNAYRLQYSEPKEFYLKNSFGYDQIAEDSFDWLLDTDANGDYIYADYLPFILDNFHFHTGHCPGEYQVTVDLADRFACPDANAGHDEFMLDITCIRRPMPLPILPCFELTFDYVYNGQAGAYPTAYMLGYDSVTPAYRDMDFAWYVYQIINDTLDTMAFYNLEVIDLAEPGWNDWTNWKMPGIEYSETNLDWQWDRPTDLDKPFQSAPDVFYAYLYLTDHCMNFYEWVEIVWHCRAPPVMHFAQDSTITFPYTVYSIPEETGRQYNGNTSYPPQSAWSYGAERIGMSCTCAPTYPNIDQVEEFFDLFDIVGCGCGAVDANNGLFAGSAHWPGTYTLQLRADDQCTYNTINAGMQVQCDPTHVQSTFAWHVTDDGAATRANGYTYAIVSQNTVPYWGNAHTLTVNDDSTGYTADFWWCDYDDDLHEIDFSSCDANHQWTIDYTGVHNFLGTRFHKVLIAWNECLYNVWDYYVTYACSPTSLPTMPTWSVTAGYGTIVGANNSAYDITLRTTTDFSASGWTDATCLIWSQALYADPESGCDLAVAPGSDCTPTESDGVNGYLMHITLTGCNMDQRNSIQIWTSYTDAIECAHGTSNRVTINLQCQWDISATAVTDAVDDTVTWQDGEFPPVCVYVPDANFRWTKPWDENFDDCNFQPCLPVHYYDFTINTPDLSVYQTANVTYDVTSPSSTVTVPDMKHPCGGASYPWLNNTFECGDGYLLSYEYTVTETISYERDMYTYLVSDGLLSRTPSDNSLTTFADGELQNSVIGACFRPDVEGDYEIHMHLEDGCLFRPTDQLITITANCGLPPTVNVETPADGDVVMGTRYSFVAEATDSNDFMLAYEWSLSYVEGGVVEDLTDYVTNAHALDASFIPIYMGMHRFKLVVWDDCVRENGTPYTVAEGTFNVQCRSGTQLVDPLRPLDDDLHEEIYSIVDFNGQGMLPIHEYVVNLDEEILFNWKVIGFTPRYDTWEQVYPILSDFYTSESVLVPPAPNTKTDVAEQNFGSTTTPLLILLSILSLFMLF